MPDPASSIFRFYCLDDAGEWVLYGCIAASVEEAEAEALRVGYREVRLFDQSALPADASSEAAYERILASPFLGPRWLPLVRAIEYATQRLRIGSFWQLQTYARVRSCSPDHSPYIQAMLLDEGWLHVELSIPEGMGVRFDEDHGAALEFLGWSPPEIGDSAELDQDGRPLPGIPNLSQVFELGWTGASVAESALSALVLLLPVTVEDFFNFDKGFAAVEDLVEVAGRGTYGGSDEWAIFRLPGSAEDAPPEGSKFVELAEHLHEASAPELQLPTSFQELVRRVHNSGWADHWATLPSPDPEADYFLTDLDKLAGPVPDAFAISELSVHLVCGSFAAVIQKSHQSGTPDESASKLADAVAVANALIQHWGDDFSGDPREREWIIVNSDERGQHWGRVEGCDVPDHHSERSGEWMIRRRYGTEWKIERFLPTAEAVIAWVRTRPGRVVSGATKITYSTFDDGDRGYAIVAGDEVYVSNERVRHNFEGILRDSGLLGNHGLFTYWVNWHGSRSSYDAEEYEGSLDGLIRLTVPHAPPAGGLGFRNGRWLAGLSRAAPPPWVAAAIVARAAQ
jgi:hypothetical protein